MSEPELFDKLRELDNESVAPRAAFANELRLRLMTELAATPNLGDEEPRRMEHAETRHSVPLTFPTRSRTTIRITPLIEIAAVAAILIGFAAYVFSGRLGGGDPPPPTTVPAAIQTAATPVAEVAEAMPEPRPGIRWELPLPAGESLDYGGAALFDGTIYRLIATPSFVGVQAVDTTSGAIVWQTSRDWNGFAIAADEAGIYLIRDQSVEALDPANGDLRWSAETETMPMSLTVNDGMVFAWDGLSSMTALDAESGDSIWIHTAPHDASEPAASQAPLAGSSAVVAVAGDGSVIAFDRQTGAHRWSIGGFNVLQIDLALASQDRLVINGNGAPNSEEPPIDHAMTVAVVDLKDGSILWERALASPTSDVIVAGSIVAILDNPGARFDLELSEDGQSEMVVDREDDLGPFNRIQLYGLDLESGDIVYNAGNLAIVSDVGDPPYVRLAPSAPGAASVLAVSKFGRIASISMDDAGMVGIVDLGGAVNGELLSDTSGVYATRIDGTLIAADAATLTSADASGLTQGDGPIDWTLAPADEDLTGFGGMAHGEGVVFRLIETSALHGIEATYGPTGGPAWRIPLAWGEQRPAADDNGLYVVTDDDQLVALSPGTGVTRWTIDFTGSPVVSMVAHDGVLYAWDETSRMTAIETATGTIVWQTASGEEGGPQTSEIGVPAPAVSNELVAMVNVSGAISAFDRESGELRWTATPGAHETDTRMVFQADRLFVLSVNPDTPSAMTNAFALDATSGETLWLNGVEGPLTQPVATNETNVYLIADAVHPGKNSPQTEIVLDPVDGSSAPWTGSEAAMAEPYVGGHRVYGIDVTTGQVLWGQTSKAGGFVQLMTGCLNSCGLSTVTSDGHVVSFSRESGTIDGDAIRLGGDVLEVMASWDFSQGTFATLSDGTLVAFGATPFNQQG